jgi:hypothetical protein
MQVVSDAQRFTGALAREGLLWFYRLAEGNPSLSEAEVVSLFNSPGGWLRNADTSTVANIYVYATETGERLLEVGT